MGLVEQVYAAATNAGLLRDCHWQPADGSPSAGCHRQSRSRPAFKAAA